jgi:hypothetical protein
MKVGRISKKRFLTLQSYADQLVDQRNAAVENLRLQTARANSYFKRLQELKAKISDVDLLLKFDNYSEDEAYMIPMPELRQLANESLESQSRWATRD